MAKCELLVIGGSAGSLSVFLKIVPHFSKTMKFGVILVFHRKQSTEDTLIELLSSRTDCLVKEVDDKDEILPGVIYIVPSDYHVLIEKNKTATLDASEKVNFSRPSIDVTFESAADVYGSRLACMLLSGANNDGADGLVKAKKNGALIIVQDPRTAEFPMMPQIAIDHTPVDVLMNDQNMSNLLDNLDDW